MYKAIVFDFYGVFCPDLTREWVKKQNHHEKLMPKWRLLCERSDRGELSKKDFCQELAELTDLTLEEVESGINEELVINSSLIEFAEDLHKIYKIGILSNTGRDWLNDTVLKDFGIDRLVDELIISADVGFSKPQKEIFNIMLQKLNANSDDVIFVDDRQDNVWAAESLGIKSILFTDTSTFIEEIQNLTVASK